MKYLFSFFLLSSFQAASAQERVVVIGGSVSEIISEMMLTEKVVGIDLTSKDVKGMEKAKNLGMPAAISAESLLSLKPDLVIYGSSNGNKKLLAQIEGKVKIVEVTEINSLNNISEKIDVIARTFSATGAGEKLKQEVQDDINSLNKKKKDSKHLKMAFIYARGPNQIFLAGKDTPAHTVIEEIGLRNAFDSIDGFKPVSSESLVKMNPDYLIMLETGVQSLTNVWDIPGLSKTNAGKNRRLIEVPTLSFLGFVGTTPKQLIAILDKVNGDESK